MTSPAQPAETLSLEQRVAEAMTGWPLDTAGAEDREAWLATARSAIPVVRDSISRDIEAEAEVLALSLGPGRAALARAARIAREGRSS